MVDELLAQFRGTAPPRTAAETSPSAPPAQEEYVAFAGKDNRQYLDIRLTRPPWHSPRSNLLVNVAHDGPMGTNFLVTYTTMSVLVRGRNLQDVVFAVQNHMAAYLQEFDPRKWPKPKNDKAPFIESIAVHFHGDIVGGTGGDAAKHLGETFTNTN